MIAENVGEEGSDCRDVVPMALRVFVVVVAQGREGDAVRAIAKGRHLPFDLLRVQMIIRVEELQITPRGACDSGVPRGAYPRILLPDVNDLVSIGSGNRIRVVVGTVVDDDDLNGGISLRKAAIDGRLEITSLSKSGDYDGN